ncbi:MAG: hypothetical protein L3K07_03850 [Thermoplasmata archaeon]|nr:hypothetical protein [Thermoplasmata archaeon]
MTITLLLLFAVVVAAVILVYVAAKVLWSTVFDLTPATFLVIELLTFSGGAFLVGYLYAIQSVELLAAIPAGLTIAWFVIAGAVSMARRSGSSESRGTSE